jgi:Zn-dependent peptidase ImmA (M78 family)
MSKRAEQAAQKLLKHYGETLPVNVAEIAQACGISIRMEKLEDTVSGMLVIKGNKVTIGVNANHHHNRQRFTIAHELGHYLLHKGASGVFFDEALMFFRNKLSSEGTQAQEIEANAFAAELLMPESLLKEQIAIQPIDAFDDAAVLRLAAQFGVSTQALIIRLTKLGLLIA